MSVLNRVSPASAFKVGFVCYAFLGLILGAFCTLVALGALPFAGREHSMLFGGTAGMFAVVLCPLLYGLIGGVGGLISAAIYNLASGWVGGLQVEIK